MRALPRETREKEKINTRVGLAVIVPIVFVLDRIPKILVLSRFAEGEGVPVFPGFFHITRVNNTGAAFGWLRNASTFLIFVSAVSIVLLTVSMILRRRRPRAADAAWALILGGALGNLYDRLRFGYVVDFLDFRVWPVFNLADACICAGVILIFIEILFSGKKGRP